MPKRICLISVEIFAWGKYGGYGKATRIIGRELVKRGYEVFAVVPRREGQQPEEILDGITVVSFEPSSLLSIGSLFQKINADIYHSCEPSMSTWLAMKAMPDAVHLITSRDPKDSKEWMMEFSHPSKSRLQVMKNYLYENNLLVKAAVRNANHVFAPAHFLLEKVRSIYNLKSKVDFLPTPTEIPEHVVKSTQPVVLYMGRLDKRKRPELTLDLARDFPNVAFKIAGKSRVPEYEQELKRKYGHLPNVEFLGFVNQFEGNTHHQIFSSAWIHVNTAIREGLPNSFVEAAGHRCAILSHVNPDDFAGRFGYHVQQDNFREGLESLLKHDKWREKGEVGFDYVNSTYGINAAMDEHERVYNEAFATKKK